MSKEQESPWMTYEDMKVLQKMMEEQERNLRPPEWLRKIYVQRDKEIQAEFNNKP
jgi:hypothetical protein